MTNKEKAVLITDALKDQDVFCVKSVENINHSPHPYCITEKHITDKYMYLGDDTIKALEKESNGKIHCGMYTKGDQCSNGYKQGYEPCHIPYEDHTSDNVCFLQLVRDATNTEANVILKALVDKIGQTIVDGFAFVETKEKFRIS